jgi:hypothetical protein
MKKMILGLLIGGVGIALAQAPPNPFNPPTYSGTSAPLICSSGSRFYNVNTSLWFNCSANGAWIQDTGGYVPTYRTLSAPTSAGTVYSSIGGTQAANASISSVQIPAHGGNYEYFHAVIIIGSLTSGQSYQITLMDNTTATAITCTINSSNSSCSDIVDTATSNNGDSMTYQIVTVGTPSGVTLGFSIGMQGKP